MNERARLFAWRKKKKNLGHTVVKQLCVAAALGGGE